MAAKDPRREHRQNRPNVSQVVGWAAASSQEARRLARRRRMQTMRLTITERETCAEATADEVITNVQRGRATVHQIKSTTDH
jgi:hypothetical protein